MERGICPIAVLYFTVKRYFCNIGHLTIRPAVGGFLYLVHWNLKPPVFRDIEPQIFWSHDLNRVGSRDVIGYVTIRSAMGGLL